jgi:hypothetical protein
VRRPPAFTVTAAGEKVKLDAAGGARAPFTVTNASARPLKGRLLTRPSDPARPEWFSIVGESVRDFGANASEHVVVQLFVPATPPWGSYSFRLDVVSADDPDEDYIKGPSIAFDVAPPAPAKRRLFSWPSRGRGQRKAGEDEVSGVERDVE